MERVAVGSVMTVMTSKMWRLRTRACRLGIIIVAALGLAWWIRPGAVYGARPRTELAELFVSLVKQCMARVQAESGEDAEIRSLGASSLVSSLLVNFYNDPVLYRTDPRLCLTGLKKAQGSEFQVGGITGYRCPQLCLDTLLQIRTGHVIADD